MKKMMAALGLGILVAVLAPASTADLAHDHPRIEVSEDGKVTCHGLDVFAYYMENENTAWWMY